MSDRNLHPSAMSSSDDLGKAMGEYHPVVFARDIDGLPWLTIAPETLLNMMGRVRDGWPPVDVLAEVASTGSHV